jgi:ABC-2 type transport system permease protein
MTTRALAVARKDFQNAAKSYLVWGVVAVLVALVVLVVALPGLVSEVPAQLAVEATTQAVGLVVPIVALAAGYLAVAGERESGTLRILLSLPPSRGAVVLGKFLARTGIVLVGILLAFALGAVASVAVYGSVPVGTLLGTAALTCVLGVVFVGLAVGISAAVGSRARAATLAVSFYFVTVVVWDLVLFAVQFVLELPLRTAAQPDWFHLLSAFPPSRAFGRLYDSTVGTILSGTPPGDAVYLTDGAMFALLALWLVVPLALGYWRFQRADLG